MIFGYACQYGELGSKVIKNLHVVTSNFQIPVLWNLQWVKHICKPLFMSSFLVNKVLLESELRYVFNEYRH